MRIADRILDTPANLYPEISSRGGQAMKKVQILGTGCPKCKKLFETTQRFVNDAGIEAEVIKVEDINEILKFGVMMTPALAVDGEVKASGRIPKPDELRAMIG
jgi:small redox-active disulfide protein 2